MLAVNQRKRLAGSTRLANDQEVWNAREDLPNSGAEQGVIIDQQHLHHTDSPSDNDSHSFAGGCPHNPQARENISAFANRSDSHNHAADRLCFGGSHLTPCRFTLTSLASSPPELMDAPDRTNIAVLTTTRVVLSILKCERIGIATIGFSVMFPERPRT
jgi:hypothetical protein